jgi:hypothetical protein
METADAIKNVAATAVVVILNEIAGVKITPDITKAMTRRNLFG